MVTIPKCHECAYWKSFDHSLGSCVRYAPKPGDGKAGWPETDSDHGCGEGERKNMVEWTAAVKNDD